MIDLKSLTWEEFEQLVELLLIREGYSITGKAKPGQPSGPDIDAFSPDGVRTIVEVKHFTKLALGASQARRFADDLRRYQEQFPGASGLLVISGRPTPSLHKALQIEFDGDVWTGEQIQTLLRRHPDVSAEFAKLLNARLGLTHWIDRQASKPPSLVDDYAARLDACAKGKEGWRDFEKLGTGILTDIFSPNLGPPELQDRSDDGLDIRDAIFPIRSKVAPWSELRRDFATRFVVAEFKNYTEEIGQKEVEAIGQYLWHQAQRMFGILVSRNLPSESAVKSRRRFWLESNKMIVFVSDAELLEMLQLKEAGGEPFDVIEGQLEDFLRTLTP